ncbi:TadE/TadG family type IV pilus assembly protein [Marinobacterium sediminicola]|uniref:TadE-like protein n=1 Tax=Marinobacterium sediminicola TaxID=518898 RepID=A0ABY1S0A0_9GAMM|nr:TadE/TadG family type IV pilus assembly protein [Marinobacterium sediminicola]ULG69965.1 pilus assembly protein [Marinobacterium sediminicola]SMR74415.1 TadE-like protein [Marinobacterium sediminicola]
MNIQRAGRSTQRGITTVEFALVGSVLFVVLFGLIEFGRLMFTWNVLDEATRRAARLAVVCPVTEAGRLFAQNEGAFKGTMLPNFTAANIAIRYLQEDGITPATSTANTYYVRAEIVNKDNWQGFVDKSIDDVYRHVFLVPMIGNFFDPDSDSDDWVPSPSFSTTLPAESLGVHPATAGDPPCGS